MTNDDDMLDLLGPDVAETLALESTLMTATLRGPCPGCGAEPTIELLGSEFDYQLVVEHADTCSVSVGGGPV